MTNFQLLNDWLRVQRTLLDQEREVADLAQRYALGQTTLDELDESRSVVLGLRELSRAVYDAMHTPASRDAAGGGARLPAARDGPAMLCRV